MKKSTSQVRKRKRKSKLECLSILEVGEYSMKSIDVIGKTVDEALNKALEQLDVTKDKVEVDIIDEGYKGLFNFIGGKPAKIKVTLKADYTDDIKNFLNKVLKCMNVNAEIAINAEMDSIYIEISGEKMGSVIGYRGETLDSLQYLVSLVVNKDHEQPYRRVVLDAENYRKKREETLKRVAEKTAYKVKKSRRAFKLEPMNPYERRIIHSALQNYADIKTFSEGEDPFRRIVVDIREN
jgi:spoIIIJ-associated protein